MVESGKTGDSYNLNYSNQKAPFARVVEGGELTVNGGAYEDNAVSMTPESAGVNKYAGGYGAVLQNGAQDGDHLHGGPDNVWGGKLVVNGGLYKNNSATRFGGGVIFSSTRGTAESTTIVTGGDFEDNSVNVPKNNGGESLRGGGVIHSRRGSLTISGGTFKNNTEKPDQITDVDFTAGGGAVYVANATITDNGDIPNGNYPNGDENIIARFTLTKQENGTAPVFEGNKSGSAGGAIMTAAYVNASFESGVFKGNYAEDMGGAVYTEENTVSDFGYSAVYGNTAAHFGGGLWLCPSGVSISSQRSNLALFDNVAGGSNSALALDKYLNVHGEGAAGDDLAIMYPNKDIAKSNSVNITSGWYTGKDAVTWYQDGQSTVKATGFGEMGTNWGIGHLYNPGAFSVVSSVPRYVAGQTAFPTGAYTLTQSKDDIPVWNQKGGIALKAIANSENAKQVAKDQAHLTFTGNMAGMSGGAIGSDGNLRFTSSGLATWSKIDANDGAALSGSSWTLTYEGSADTPYADASEESDLWNGVADTSAKWSKVSGAWVAAVEDNTGQDDYVGYDTDSRPGYFSIENLAEGAYSLAEASAPEGYAKGNATYTFAVDLSTATSAAKMPQVYVKNGNAVSGNAIGNTPLPSIPDIVLKAKKTLVGGTLDANQFSFKLDEQSKDGSSYKYENKQTKTNDANGSVTFDKLTYTKPGNYVYRIMEAAGTDASMAYDTTAYYVKVSVTWGWKDANGKPVTEGTAGAKANLVASVLYYSDEACTQKIDGAAYPSYAPEFTNYATTSFSFTKVDGSSDGNNAPLKDASFKLYKWVGAGAPDAGALASDDSKDWQAQGDGLTSSADGIVKFDKLVPGVYQLVETAAPAGYQQPTGQWRFEVKVASDNNGLTTTEPQAIRGAGGTQPPAFISPDSNLKGETLKLPNYKGFTLPVSGSSGIWLSGVAGMAMIAASLAALWWQRRRGGGGA